MASSKPKLKTFFVQAKLYLWADVEIKASSLEDAVAQSKELEEDSFVDFHGDYIDGNMEITGVLKND